VSAAVEGTVPAATTGPAVDARNPWLGLASFTEETRQYFYGREDEVAELARRVQRKRLTVLFGQSGLGKTSILRAGLVPRLRAQGYCPVYVRIDYGRESPPPAEQIKQAIARTARRSGEWTQVGVAEAGESLWEFLHHRDDVLRDEAGATLIPLLIFDQFEEIFTLGQGDDFGRARAATFVTDLADLVENRPPAALEAKLESDETAAERFDFARSDYRVLIALREDYLAPLEGLKSSMPSITQNRLRLAPMTGAQALAAVTGPGAGLVSDEVAAAIVRFVAGGAEIANAEVEPSLLSLICRELNDTRLAQGRDAISLDILDGSRSAILGSFYERALVDQPPAVRRVIEDELLTASGFRENIAEERMQANLAAAGAAPDALAVLVNRRLLRIEERLDVRRVELTHDVLCDVVKASRDLRQAREAREKTERLLAEQKTRELAARAALVRARQVATGCAVLAILAIVAASFAYLSTERAHRAELAARESRAQAERARSEAEHLLGYLNDDFASELEGFGRLGLVLELGQKELDYYRSLPATLQTTDTVSSEALAKVRFGIALQMRGKLQEAGKILAEAVVALEKLRGAGDTSERTAIGLGLGYGAQGDVDDRVGKGSGLALAEKAEETLRPYFDAPNPSIAVRRAYGILALSLGTYQGEHGEAAIERSRLAYASLGALELKDLQAAAYYASAEAFECEPLYDRGRIEELRRLANEAVALAQRVLDVRPGHLVALRARQSAYGYLAAAARDEMQLAQAIALFAKADTDGAALVRLDPTNIEDRFGLEQTARRSAEIEREMGQPRAAIVDFGRSIASLRSSPNGSELRDGLLAYGNASRALLQADLGDDAASAESTAALERQVDAIRRERPANDELRIRAEGLLAVFHAEMALLHGDAKAASVFAMKSRDIYAQSHPGNFAVAAAVTDRRIFTGLMLAEASYRLGDYAGAEQAAREALEVVRSAPLFRGPEKRREARVITYEALALARLGRTDDARTQIEPVIKLEREYFARNRDSAVQRLDLAKALFVEALVDVSRRAEHLRESAAILAALPAEMRRLKSIRAVAARVDDEISGRAPTSPAPRR
jgi:hypothetical protein